MYRITKLLGWDVLDDEMRPSKIKRNKDDELLITCLREIKERVSK